MCHLSVPGTIVTGFMSIATNFVCQVNLIVTARCCNCMKLGVLQPLVYYYRIVDVYCVINYVGKVL